MHIMLDEHMHIMHSEVMTLDDYLTGTKESDTAFGIRAGISQSQVSRLRRGECKPSWANVAAIAAATDGAVTAIDWTPAIEAAE